MLASLVPFGLLAAIAAAAVQDGAASPLSEPFTLVPSWRLATGAGYSLIATDDEVAVVMFSDGRDDCVAAFALADGEERWRVSLGQTHRGKEGAEDGPRSAPVIADSTVFALGPKGKFLAVDLDSGAVRWSVDLVGDHGAIAPHYGFGATPIVTGDVVFVPFGTGDGGSGTAFDAGNGAVKWSHQGKWVDYQSTIRVEDEILAVDVSDVAWLDPDTGEVRRRFTHLPDGRDLAYPQIAAVGVDRLVFAYERRTLLFEVSAGEAPLRQLWRSLETKDCYIPPMRHGDALFGMSGTFLVAVDIETGRRLWKSREPGARGITLLDGHLLMFASSGELVVAAADPERYREVARVRVADRGGYTPPAVSGNRVVMRNTSGLYCVEIQPVAAGSAAPAVSTEPELTDALASLASSVRDADRPDELIERWWNDHPTMPLVEADRFTFVYRGKAEDVALVGDMADDRYVPLTMHRLGTTDLFYRTVKAPPHGLWQYAFLIDFDRAIPDPRNPEQAQAVTEIGGNPLLIGYQASKLESVARMPGNERPGFLEPVASGGGRLETVTIPRRRPQHRDLTVYVPAGYDDSTEDYPTLYVLGTGWFEHGNLKNVLDRFIGTQCAAAIVVNVPYDPGSRDWLDSTEYELLFFRQVVPRIERRYRTRDESAVMGAADSASPALVVALRAPEKFPRVAVQSPFTDPEDFAILDTTDGAPDVAYVDWSRYEPRIGDENLDYRAVGKRVKALLEERGSTVFGGEVVPGPGWPSWSSRLDRVLATLLPLE